MKEAHLQIGFAIRSFKVVVAKSVANLLRNHQVDYRYSYLLRVVAKPLLQRLVCETKNGILHVLFNRYSHCVLYISEPTFDPLSDFHLSIE